MFESYIRKWKVLVDKFLNYCEFICEEYAALNRTERRIVHFNLGLGGWGGEIS